jgi:hypothetical protein
MDDLGKHFLQHGDYPRVAGIEPYGEITFTKPDFVIETNKGLVKIRSIQLTLHIHRIFHPTPIKTVLQYGSPGEAFMHLVQFSAAHEGQTLCVLVAKGRGDTSIAAQTEG